MTAVFIKYRWRSFLNKPPIKISTGKIANKKKTNNTKGATTAIGAWSRLVGATPRSPPVKQKVRHGTDMLPSVAIGCAIAVACQKTAKAAQATVKAKIFASSFG